MKRAGLADEQGASLIMALVFVILASALIGGLLSIGTTSFAATKGIQDQRKEVYAADGAVEAAIAWFQRASTPELFLKTEHDCFQATSNGITSHVRCQFTGESILAENRTVTFTGIVNGSERVRAVAIFLDGGLPPDPADPSLVDITSWRYLR